MIKALAALLRSFVKQPMYTITLISRKLRMMSRYRWMMKHEDMDDKVPPPLVYEFVLTLKCNLRCSMCMYWGDRSDCPHEPDSETAKELDMDVIRKVVADHHGSHPSFILHGGEPFLHSGFGDIVQLLKDRRCSTIVCTNGTLIDRFTDKFDGNPYIDLFVSLDGTEKENDSIRGEGVYKKVTDNIRLLKKLSKPPRVTIQCTVMPENVGTLYRFCEEMAELGVDWILMNPCWSLTEEQKEAYEAFMRKKYGVDPVKHLGYVMNYDLDPVKFSEQYKKIRSRKWPMRVSCYFVDPENDIFHYVEKYDYYSSNRVCYKQWVRMDVTQNGEVSPCIRYPDLIFGDLKESDVMSIWNNEKFAQFRRDVRKEPLPICNKCNCIYLYDAKRKSL